MCGKRSGRHSRSSFILCFFLLASSLVAASPDVAQMTDAQLMSELRQNLIQQSGLLPELQLSLTDLNQALQESETRLDSALSSSATLSLKMQDAEKSLQTLESRLTGLEKQVPDVRRSLNDTTSSLTDLSASLTSCYEEAQSQIAGLKRQNILWIVLTVAASALAVTALVID